ncbi:rho-related GTP-binding protein RhoH-like [Saccostrea cucullata]|uniref:rho-related GTP-binding protein RhoH-like n=1 Tax=Saccostrea cuccullata TaxID=36930 RepID=UPI002ED150C4
MESQRDSEGYERPLSCVKCDKHVQFVCEPCDSSFCNKCVGEHVSNRESGSHDVTFHKMYREKVIKKNKRKESVPVIKCVVDGWQMSGKTSMIQAYIDGKCPKFESIHPTVHEIHTVDIRHQGREVCIHLYDIPTCEFYDGLRRVILQEVTYDVILLCIPIDFVNLERESKILLKNFNRCLPDPPPVIVIATKIDLREKGELKRKLLTSEELRHFARTINAVGYFECSAVQNESFEDILQEIATIYFTPGKLTRDRRLYRQHEHCLIM